ncbi:hypothetical protein CYMTET_55810 [Cymbomonas tetramitiformis]|uniref:Uncharacterized protein n=1 Tax=Cymbomonas tetramitiformis TaxID=36881 RepID=A0AAE0BC86_9CHLO|nr:hypothetical protein CYMTET_55810 [Cymbomonas tetramitiformis]
MDAGLDSLGAVELRNGLAKAVGMELPGTLVFDYPSVGALAGYLTTQVGGDGGEDEDEDSDEEDEDYEPSELGSSDIYDLYDMGSMQQELIDVVLYASDVDRCDMAYFGMSSNETETSDPQQRLLLMATMNALSLGGETPAEVKGSDRSVYVGICAAEYATCLRAHDPTITPYSALAGTLSVACGRISYNYGYSGECLSVDTACSSSLVCSHLAGKTVRSGLSGSAVACGMNLTMFAQTYVFFQTSGMLAPDGRCKTLDQKGDGYVRGEACGVAQMKALDEEAEDVGMGLVTVCGSEVNQDGRSSSLTAPNGPSQQAAIRAGVQAAGLMASQIEQLEMHGTGTSLGDPIEVGACVAVLLGGKRTGPLTLLAAKTAHGHTEGGAGMVGLTHAVSDVTHMHVSRLTHLQRVNPYCADQMDIHMQTVGARQEMGAVSVMSSQNGTASGTGISSFAFQGTNAHVILGYEGQMTGHCAKTTVPWEKQSVYYMTRPHQLCSKVGVIKKGKSVTVETFIGGSHLAYLWDHRVNGKALYPGTGFLELSTAAAAALTSLPTAVARVSIRAPLEMADEAPAAKDRKKGALWGPAVHCTILLTEGKFEVKPAAVMGSRSAPASVVGEVTALAPMTVLYSQDSGSAMHKHLALATMLWAAKPTAQASAGEGMVGVIALGLNKVRGTGYRAHPAAMDNCLQMSAGANMVKPTKSQVTRVPAAIAGFMVYAQACGVQCYATAFSQALASPTAPAISSHMLQHANHPGSAELVGLEARIMPSGPASAGPVVPAFTPASEVQVLYVSTVLASRAPKACPAPGTWRSVHIGSRYLHSAMGQPAGSLAQVTGITFWSSSSPNLVKECTRLLETVKGALNLRLPAVQLQTFGAQQVGASPQGTPACTVGASALQGLMRTVAAECPSLEVTTVDNSLEGAHPGDTGGVARSQKLLLSKVPIVPGEWQLRPHPRGSLNSLKTVAGMELMMKEPEGAPFHVRAVGVNFRDVLNVLGAYPGDPGPPGADCAGVWATNMVSVGIRAGDAAFGLAAGSMGSVVCASINMMPPKPSALSFEAVSTTPTVFVTVQMALQQATCMGPGDTFLAHAAAGGVGLASIQLCNPLGCQVVGTAGGSSKRALVRKYGVTAAVGSRDTSFADDLAAAGCFPGGTLNSLTSTGFVAATLSVLAAEARFVEIAKREIWTRHRTSMERMDVNFNLLATDFLPVETNGDLNLFPLSVVLAKGMVAPLPELVYSMGDTPMALRMMSQARHVGKVVVNMTSPQATRQGGVFWLTGGLGSLGLMMAEWLSTFDASPLWLLGRSGRVSGQDEQLHKLWQSASLMTARRCDSSSMEEADMVPMEGPLAGVLHAGGVLMDATIANQNLARFRGVFAPKLDGLGNMTISMQMCPMTSAVLFSSIASTLGGVGQANYTAANSALDATAYMRQSQGLAGGSAQWGTWSGGGMALREPQTIARAEKVGLGVVMPDAGLTVLSAFMKVATVGVGKEILGVATVSPFVWPTLLEQIPDAGFFSEHAVALPKKAGKKGKSKSKKPAKKAVKKAPKKKVPKKKVPKAKASSEEQTQALIAQVTETVAGVIGASPSADEPLMDAGLDSLGAVELRNGLAKAVGMELPGTLVFDYPSVGALAGYLTTQVGGDGGMDEDSEEDSDEEYEVAAPRRRRQVKKASKKKVPKAKASSEEQTQALIAQVTETVAGVIGASPSADEPLMDAGLDSLGAVELRNGLAKAVGMELPGTLVFDYPSVGALAGYLTTQVGGDGGEDDDEDSEEDSDEDYEVAAPSRRRQVKKAPKKKVPKAKASSEEQTQALIAQVTETVAGVIGASPSADEPLMDAGLDSLGAVELRNGLAKAVGMELPGTLVFDYPSVGALAGYLTTQVGGDGGEDDEDEDSEEDSDEDYEEYSDLEYGLAAHEADVFPVVATAALCQGSAGFLQKLTPDVSSSFDGICAVPLERWDIEQDFTDGKPLGAQQVRFGGFMQDVDRCDMAYFGITKNETIQTDPQQRHLMMNSWRALHMAGESPAGVKGSDRSVYVGVCHTEYAALLRKLAISITPFTALVGALSVSCGRISYTYGYSGECLSVDTACSSSLVCSHLAGKTVRSGDSGSAVACGVNMTLVAQTFIFFQTSGMLAPDGRCKTLDQKGDGYVRGEACGVVQMKALDEEAEDVGMGLVTVCGSEVNQDGRSSSLTAPNGPSQQAAIRAGVQAAGLMASQIEQLEMHGTGTSLGDPIEVGACVAVLLGGKANRDTPLVFLAAKTAHGHTEGGAGVLGLTHAVQDVTVAHCSLLTHLRSVNPYVADQMDIHSMSVGPRQDIGMVTQHMKRVSGTGASSFAFQGTNAHVIIAGAGVDAGYAYKYRDNSTYEMSSIWVVERPHPLRTAIYANKKGKSVTVETAISGPNLAYLWDHRVNGKALYPGTGFLELSTAAAQGMCEASMAITKISIRAPLEMADEAPAAKDRKKGALWGPAVHCTILLTEGKFEVKPAAVMGSRSAPASVAGEVTALAPMTVLYSQDSGSAMHKHLALATMLWAAKPTAQASAGEGMVGVIALGLNKVRGTGYRAHPAAMDNCLQMSAGANMVKPTKSQVTRVPAAIAGFMVYAQACGVQCYATAFSQALASPTAPAISSHMLQHANHPGSAELVGLEARIMPSGPASAGPVVPAFTPASKVQVLYVSTVLASRAPKACPAPGTWRSVHIGSRYLHSAMGQPAGSLAQVTGITFWSSSSPNLVKECTRLLETVKGALNLRLPAVQLQTFGAQQVGASPQGTPACTVGASALQGLMRTVAAECPSLEVTTVDNSLEGAHPGDTGGVARSQKLLLSKVPIVPGEWQLRPHPRGSLNSLKTVAGMELMMEEPEGAPFHVRAVGVNFRDVLNVLGAYPGDPGPPGADCAGVWATNMVSVGIRAGDAAFGLSPGAMGSVVCGFVRGMPPKPSALSFEAVSTTPTVFVTVQMALQQATCMGPGDTFLAHAAAGGVGLASIQLCNPLGCQVVGTAGGSSKRALVRKYGVTAAVGSRDTSFADDLAAAGCFPGGTLNSLTSTGFVAATLSVLAAEARFVEIAKREIWTRHRTSMERMDVNFNLLATDFLPVDKNGDLNLFPLSVVLAKGMVAPLPELVYSMGDTPMALRMMSQARHVGKVVVNMTSPQATRQGGVFWLTGGLGSLGLMMAEWLSTFDASPLWLLGRSGRVSGQDEQLHKLWQSASLMTARRCDSSSMEEADMVPMEGPLAGVLHAGGVLMDATIANQNLARFRGVFAPKLDGLGNMTISMQMCPMTSAVLFSSIASTLGGVGQANYTAANSALDATAYMRQSQGLAGGSAQWGTWSGGGMALREPQTIARAEKMGLGVVMPDAGLTVLSAFMKVATVGVGKEILGVATVSPFVWPTLLGQIPDAGFFSEHAVALPKKAGKKGKSKSKKPAKKSVKKAPKKKVPKAKASSEEQTQALIAQVTETVAGVIGASPSADEPLMDAGLDSLGAVELRNGLAKAVGMELPGTLVFDYPSDSEEDSDEEYEVAAPRRRRQVKKAPKKKVPKAKASSEEQTQALIAQVTETVAGVIGASPSADEPLMDAGLDSLGAVELRNGLAKAVGMELPGTLVFDYPSVGALAGYLTTQVGGDGGEDDDEDSEEDSDEDYEVAAPSRRRQVKKAPKKKVPKAKASSEEQTQALIAQVTETVAGVIGASPSADEPLMDAGLDSLGAVELRNGLAKAVGMELPGTLVFDYPSVGALAGYLTTQVGGDGGEDDEDEDSEEDSDEDYEEYSDIEYMGALDAGDSLILVSVRAALCRGSGGMIGQDMPDQLAPVDGICAVPWERWDIEHDFVEGKPLGAQQVRFGGFMQDVDLCDMAGFGITGNEAVQTDPSQRMLLMSTIEALAAAGETRKDVMGCDRGIYVGICAAEYATLMRKQAPQVTPYTALVGALSVACGRISYTFGFTGTSISVDTACSSSLVCSHWANLAIRNGASESSAAYGTNLTIIPSTYVFFQTSGMLAPDGRCKTLDQKGDGYVRGEACGVAQMKALDEEAEDVGMGLVTVCGSEVNQDGRSSSLTAPNGPSQQAAIRAGVQAAGLMASQIEQLEMHGTGTSLGDPIEVGACVAVLLGGKRTGTLTLLAAKTAHGHTEGGAGMVGFVHAVSDVTHMHVSRLTHLQIMNPYVADQVDIHCQTVCPKQEAGAMSVLQGKTSGTGISSFAFQGTNAHIILGKEDLHQHEVHSVMERNIWDLQAVWFAPRAHPLCMGVLSVKKGKSLQLQCVLNGASPAYLWDHQVSGRALLPGTGFMELSTAAVRSLVDEATFALVRVAIKAPLEMPPPTAPAAPKKKKGDAPELAIICMVDLVSGQYEVKPAAKGGPPSFTSGSISHIAVNPARGAHSADAPTRGEKSISAALRLYRADGGAPAPSGSFMMGRIRLGLNKVRGTGYMAHPAAMDNSLQLSAGCKMVTKGEDHQMRVPAAAGAFLVRGQACGVDALAWAYAAKVLGPTAPALSSHTLVNRRQAATGRAELAGLEARLMPKQPGAVAAPTFAVPDRTKVLYVGTWQARLATAPTPGRSTGRWQHVEAAAGGLALRRSEGAGPLAGIVFTGSKESATRHSLAVQCVQLLEVVNHAVAVKAPALQLSTLGGHQVGALPMGSPAVRVLQSALQGVMRTVAAECHTLQNSTMDSAHELAYPARSDGGRCLVHTQKLLASQVPIVPGEWQLRPHPRGSLNSLKTVTGMEATTADSASAALHIRAVGVNFRDVLNVLGAYPGDPGPPGADCAGVWTNTVVEFGIRAGDAAFGLSPGSMGTVVAGVIGSMPPKPSALSFEAVSTTPTVFVTVQMALQQATCMGPGDTFLAHAAAGGVGLASIQLCNPLGCQVVGTAGGSSKRALVRKYGVTAAVGSRDTSFADDLAAAGCFPGGTLNSLTSTGFVAATLSVLAAEARFVEIAKREIWTRHRTSMERMDVNFNLLATDFLPVDKNGDLNLSPLSVVLAKGMVAPLPELVYSMGDTPMALRMMSQARHVGKVVVNMTSPQATRQGGVFWLTGGLGSLGLMMAEWLSTFDASPLWLLGRSGRVSGQDEQLHKLWQSASLMTARRCDSSSMEEADMVPMEGPLAGVLHAGGVLMDATIANQNLARFRGVFAPKLDGLGNMTISMQMCPMTSAVLFSSIASTLGGVGQANYTAANSALDATAYMRQSQGLAGGSAQWGTWSGGGMALREPQTIARAEKMGLGVVMPDAGLTVLSAFMKVATVGVGKEILGVATVSPFVWPTFLQNAPDPGLFSEHNVPVKTAAKFSKSKKTVKKAPKKKSPKESKPKASAEDARAGLVAMVAEAVAGVTGSSIGEEEPLMDAGLDSLGAVELRNALSKNVGMELPGTLVFDYPSVGAMAGYLAIEVAQGGGGAGDDDDGSEDYDDEDDEEEEERVVRRTRRVKRAKGGDSKAGKPQQSSEEKSAALVAMVSDAVAGVVGTRVGENDPLMDAGLDSLGAVELRNSLSKSFGAELPGTLVFDYPSVGAMAGYLAAEVSGEGGDEDDHSDDDDDDYTDEEYDEIEVVGRSGKLGYSAPPKPVVSVVSFSMLDAPNSFFEGGEGWQASDGIAVVPLMRWDADHELVIEQSARMPARFSGFLEGITEFDAAAFGVLHQEACAMDPQQRMLLTATQRVLLSGRRSESLGAAITPNCAVGVGIAGMEYSQLVRTHAVGMPAYRLTGNTLSVACGRLGYWFGMAGPCLSVDTACSSSLTSTAMISAKLFSGENGSAMCCGVHVLLDGVSTYAFNSAGMLALDGRCKTLDATADGYVRSEGCSAMQLSTQMTARSTEASLLSACINQDGRSSSLTAPNGPSQSRLIATAVQSAELKAEEVDNLEMHGTGTGLGDPIEIFSALNVLLPAKVTRPLMLSAKKSHVGHSEAASGMVGLCGALKHMLQAVAPNIEHLKQVNPHVSLTLHKQLTTPGAGTTCLMKQAYGMVAKQREYNLTYGVSSFAFQGSNGHIVLNINDGGLPAALGNYWDNDTYWYMPKPHPLAARAMPKSRDTVRMEANLMVPSMSYILQHAAVGSMVLPAGFVLEMVAASLRAMLPINVGRSALQPLITDAAFAAPMLLPPKMTDMLKELAKPTPKPQQQRRSLAFGAKAVRQEVPEGVVVLEVSPRGFLVHAGETAPRAVALPAISTGAISTVKGCQGTTHTVVDRVDFVAVAARAVLLGRTKPILSPASSNTTLERTVAAIAPQDGGGIGQGYYVHPASLEACLQLGGETGGPRESYLAALKACVVTGRAMGSVLWAAASLAPAAEAQGAKLRSSVLSRQEGAAGSALVVQGSLFKSGGAQQLNMRPVDVPQPRSKSAPVAVAQRGATPSVGASQEYLAFGRELKKAIAYEVLLEDEWDPKNDGTPLSELGVDSFMFSTLTAKLPEEIRGDVTLEDSVEAIIERAKVLEESSAPMAASSGEVADETTNQEVLEFAQQLKSAIAYEVLLADEWDPAHDDVSLSELGVDSFMFSTLVAKLPEEIREKVTLQDSVEAIIGHVQQLQATGQGTAEPSRASVPSQSAAVRVDERALAQFAAVLRATLVDELVIEGEWPAEYDTQPIGDLGVSSFMVAMVKEKLTIPVEVTEEDSVDVIVRRAQQHLAGGAPLAPSAPLGPAAPELDASLKAELEQFAAELKHAIAFEVLLEDEWDSTNDDKSLSELGVDSFMFSTLVAKLPEEVRGQITMQDSVVAIIDQVRQAFAGDTAPASGVDIEPASNMKDVGVTLAAFERALKAKLLDELVLEGDWPAEYDDRELGDLGVSSFMVAMVKEALPIDVEVKEEDTVNILLARASEKLGTSAPAAPATSTAPQPSPTTTAVAAGALAAFERALKAKLLDELVLEGDWPAEYDDRELGDLGVSSFMVAMVKEALPIDVEVKEEDTVNILLARASEKLGTSAPAAPATSTAPQPSPTTAAVAAGSTGCI